MNLVPIIVVASILLIQAQGDVTRCITQGNSSKCIFDPSQLNIGVGSSLQSHDALAAGSVVECDALVTENGWYGDRCNGNARDANFIQRSDRNGRLKVFGSIRIGSSICSVRPNAVGEDTMTCTPEAEFPPEKDGLQPSADENDEDYDAHVRDLLVGYDPTHAVGGAADIHGRMLYDDNGSNIDVLVVWTRDAECVTSGLSKGCTLTATTEANMRGLIDLAVEETNTAYSLSGILSTLRLVHAYRDSTYVEPTTFDEALRNLRSTSDGKLDSVHALRTLYGADMVQMITSQKDFCGIGYVSTSRANAFAVVSWDCATGYYSYGHEIGHNFGMLHDRGTENSCSASGFNFGYRSPTAAFRSILAYSCKVKQCDNMPTDGCSRVQRFSNNQFLYNGQPIGNTNNNNALQFNNFRSTVAAHFPAMNCQSNIQCNDNKPNTVDTCNVAKAICVFTVTSIVPTVPTPVALPSAPIPVSVPTARIPVTIPITSSPVAVPSTPMPVDVPTSDTPVSLANPETCGLLGLSIFCPFTLCGLFGRILGFCVS